MGVEVLPPPVDLRVERVADRLGDLHDHGLVHAVGRHDAQAHLALRSLLFHLTHPRPPSLLPSLLLPRRMLALRSPLLPPRRAHGAGPAAAWGPPRRPPPSPARAGGAHAPPLPAPARGRCRARAHAGWSGAGRRPFGAGPAGCSSPAGRWRAGSGG